MEENKNFLKTEDVNSKGYGIVPKLVMQDKELDVVAKSFYAYLCSFAGAGDTAFPTLDKICEDLNVSKHRLLRHRKLLIEKGYITVSKVRENGKFKHNIYTLNKIISPCVQKPHVENLHEEKPHVENVPTNNNNLLNNNNINNNNINNIYNSEFDKKEKEKKKQVKEIIDLYKSLDTLPKFEKVTPKREKMIGTAINKFGLEKVKYVLQEASKREALLEALEENKTWYKFDFLFKEEKIVNILEGMYKQRFNVTGGANNGLQQHTRGLSNEEQDIWDKLQSL